MDRPAQDFPFPSLVWSGERRSDLMSYFTLFPIGQRMRANLFTYHTQNDPWATAFRANPATSLRELMPDFERLFGPLGVSGEVITRPIDLLHVEGERQAGVVLVGDAFCTVCPATGTGAAKALNDVARLSQVYVPRWLATPGMDAGKIAAFYDDSQKQARDAASIRTSHSMRAIKLDGGLQWKLKRLRENVIRRGVSRVQSALLSQREHAGASR